MKTGNLLALLSEDLIICRGKCASPEEMIRFKDTIDRLKEELKKYEDSLEKSGDSDSAKQAAMFIMNDSMHKFKPVLLKMANARDSYRIFKALEEKLMVLNSVLRGVNPNDLKESEIESFYQNSVASYNAVEAIKSAIYDFQLMSATGNEKNVALLYDLYGQNLRHAATDVLMHHQFISATLKEDSLKKHSIDEISASLASEIAQINLTVHSRDYDADE